MAGLLDTLTVKSLPPAFNAGGFDCGNADLSEYLCDGTASREEAAGVGRTYLVYSGDQQVAYFNVLADSIRLSVKERIEGVPYSSAPAVKLGRMAVALGYQGRGIGTWVLDYVVGMARLMAGSVGVRYVSLDAKTEELATGIYARYGFVRNEGHETGLKVIRNFFRKTPMGEALPHVSMRFDIMLKEEPAPGEPTP